MKYFLLILAFCFSGAAYSQVPTGVPQLFGGPYYEFRKYVLVDSLILMPCADTTLIPNKPAFIFRCADSTFYFWNTQRWNKLAKASDIYWQLDASNNLTNKTFAGDNIIPFKNLKVIQPGFTGSQFSTWPTGNNTAFNHNVLAIYGDEPSLDILIDSASQFNIGGITFRGADALIPRLNAARFGANAAAKLEYNAFFNGDTTATVELYIGDRNATTIHTFAWSLPGNHFFGFRRQYTAESKEGLMFGTAIKGVNSAQISALTDTSYFAGDAGNKNMYIFNMPTVVADTTNYRPWVTHNTTAATTRTYWSGLGLFSLNSLSGFAQTFATGTSGTDFAISSSGTTHTFNIPTSSAANRGLLSSSDWTTFNDKLSNITGYITAGSDIVITGSGTLGSPYNISATGGGGSGMAITGLVTAGTPGSALYVGTNSLLQQSPTQYFFDSTNIRLGVGTNAPARTLHLSLSDAVTNSISTVTRSSHATSGTATTGFGMNRELELENASGSMIIAATENVSWTDATNGSEDAQYRVRLPQNGTLGDKFTVSSFGEITSHGATYFSSQPLMYLGLSSGLTNRLLLSTGNTFGTTDFFTQSTAGAAGYGIFETATGLGTIISTGNNTPVFFAPNRVIAARFNTSGELQIASATDQGAFTLQNTGGLYQNGTVQLRAVPLGTPTMNILVHHTDSNVYQIPAPVSGTATLDFPSTAAGTSSDLTVTVTGAADGDVVSIGVPNGSTVANGCFTAWVSAANTVTIRFSNNDVVSSFDPASGTFKATVFKF